LFTMSYMVCCYVKMMIDVLFLKGRFPSHPGLSTSVPFFSLPKLERISMNILFLPVKE
jgi:hypothetical protein